MKKKLLTQMCNEWRSNVWMIVELVIVGVVLWIILSVFAGLAYLHKEPVGLNFDNVYSGSIGYVRKSASTYKEYSDSVHGYGTDLEMLLNKLRGNRYVKEIGTGANAIPYNYNYYGRMLKSKIEDSVEVYYGNARFMTPDMIRVIELEGKNGETTEALAKMVEEGKLLISTIENQWYYSRPEMWVGHQAILSNDSSTVYDVGGLINGIRRSDYEPCNGVIIQNLADPTEATQVAIKVHDGKGREFIESLSADDMEFGNVYFYDIRSIEDLKADAHFDVNVLYRNLTACALFLLMAVFSGFLGTFWYRTQQRVPELALRKVNGATNRDIFKRFLGEGFMLLGVSAVPIVGLSYLILRQFDLQDAWIPMPEMLFLSMMAASIAVLAIIITAGISLPAKKAMRVNPAQALKEQ